MLQIEWKEIEYSPTNPHSSWLKSTSTVTLNMPVSLLKITCVTSSPCFPWLSNKDQMLSNEICRIFLFLLLLLQPKIKAQVPRAKTYMDACISSFKFKLRLDCPRSFAFVVVTLTSCAFLWKVQPLGQWGFFFFPQGDKFACLPPEQWRRRVPRKGSLLSAQQKGNVFTGGLLYFTSDRDKQFIQCKLKNEPKFVSLEYTLDCFRNCVHF